MLARGDVRRLPLADESVDCCVTSPPYWGLREYDEPNQIGLEPTPDLFVANMVEAFTEVWRVLKPAGTLWMNLGDSYVTAPHGPGSAFDPKWPEGRTRPGDRGANRGYRGARLANGRGDQAAILRKKDAPAPPAAHVAVAGLKHKDMVGMPWRVAFALQAAGWWLRCDVIWHKPNPMPESVTDRPTKSHEYIFLLTKAAHYYYDAEAIKEPVTGNAHPRGLGLNPKTMAGKNEATGDRTKAGFNERWKVKQNASFAAAVSGLVDERNKRSVWTVAPFAYAGAHFATYPPDLIKPCILAGCPPNGIVLDPFMGSGTTGRVAEDLGRRWIGFDLSAKYLRLAQSRTAQLGLLARAGG